MPADEAPLLTEVLRAFDAMRPSRGSGSLPAPAEIGCVVQVSSGVAHVAGLPGAQSEELITFEGGLVGLALDLGEETLAVALLGGGGGLAAGSPARRTGRVADVPVGEALLGRVVDPLGRPLDGRPPIAATVRWPIEREAPAIMDRAPVSEPLQTGVKVLDALIPIGRGQRELILGDRQTGKSTLAVDTILAQDDVTCVYCAIGQRTSAVAQVVATLREAGALSRCVVVVAAGEDAPGLRYVAPYAATSIAEAFMAAGRPALVVYDDLTAHARTYRELALLMRRPPGREAFPGDVFYLHARLLERATRLSPELGGGSLTALPIAETEAQNIAAYIPTNLISITDGQVVLSPDLFQRGMLPAVSVGQSVSRVGGKAQLPAYHAIAGDLKLAYAQFEELEAFSRFGARLDAETRRQLAHGRRVRELLKQPEHAPMPVIEQLAVLDAAARGCFDAVAAAQMQEAEGAVRQAARALPPEIVAALLGPERPRPGTFEALRAACEAALAPLAGPAEDKPATPPVAAARAEAAP